MTDPADSCTEVRAPGPAPANPPASVGGHGDVFGDVLPDQTTDERVDGADRWAEADDADDRLRREVPPHY